MTDPASVAASAGIKAVVSAASKTLTKGPPRLGGREERREVYARYLGALAQMTSFTQYLRLEEAISGPLMGRARSRDLMKMVHEHQTEMLQSYHELKLVGNPEPVACGEAAMSAVSYLGDGIRVDAEAFEERLQASMDALLEFTTSCRADLWYLPRWWQLWRGAWWTARVQRLLRRNGKG